MKTISLCLLGAVCGSAAFAQTCASIPVGFNLAANGGRLNGFVPFPLSSYWHRDISSAAADPNSSAYVADVRQGGDRRILSLYPPTYAPAGEIQGFHYHVVAGTQPRVNVYYDVPQAVATFTNGSTAVSWVSGSYFDGLGGAGAAISVAGMVGNWFEGTPTSYTISSVGGCTSGGNCTTAVLTTSYGGLTGSHAINGTSIPSQSEPGPMPIPMAPREQNSLTLGQPFPNYAYASTTDGHVIVIDKDNCVLYELFQVAWDGHNVHAGVGAVFDLLGGDDQRPNMWTSGSVSGLPLFPGFLRDEELSGSVPINHPITVTLEVMAGTGNWFPKHSWIAPAEHHQYGTGFNPWWYPSNIPFGALLRLVPSFDVSPYDAQGQLILNAMKKYGAIFVDGGNTVDLYAASGWNWDVGNTQYMYDNFAVRSSDFEVITSGNPVYCDPLYATTGYNGGNVPVCPNSTSSISGATPVISSFTASSSTVTAGQPVTLSWNVTGASTRLRFLTPNIGPVVTNGVTVTVYQSTTYTLMVENLYGQSTATVTVNVGR